jgi:hypothetical protein
MPNALLARYFEARGVLQEFDFAAMKETKIEPLFEAWMALPEAWAASSPTAQAAGQKGRRSPEALSRGAGLHPRDGGGRVRDAVATARGLRVFLQDP